MPNFEPFSNAECRALVLAERLDRAGELLTNSDGVKLVTVTKLVHRGLMQGINNRDDGLGWPSRITEEGRVVARALAWWSTPSDPDLSTPPS